MCSVRHVAKVSKEGCAQKQARAAALSKRLTNQGAQGAAASGGRLGRGTPFAHKRL